MIPVIPVAGVEAYQLTDTFGADRDGGSRRHKGIDIFADPGTPVVSAVPGIVRMSGNSGGLGGVRVWVQGDDGRYYYYAHLSSANVAPGQRVDAGQMLGRVGNTGNAANTAAHLHFSINSKIGSETGIQNPWEFLMQGRTQPVDLPAGAYPHGYNYQTQSWGPRNEIPEGLQINPSSTIDDGTAPGPGAPMETKVQAMMRGLELLFESPELNPIVNPELETDDADS